MSGGTWRSSAIDVSLPSDTEIILTRDFRAPRQLVFDAFTKAEHIVEWMSGPDDWRFITCEVDLRPGGGWRFVYRGPDRTTMATRGMYEEVSPAKSVVGREIYDDFADIGPGVLAWPSSPEGEAASRMSFDEINGVTRFTEVLTYRSREARDGALRTGMTVGMAAGFDRLDAHLARLSPEAGRLRKG